MEKRSQLPAVIKVRAEYAAGGQADGGENAALVRVFGRVDYDS